MPTQIDQKETSKHFIKFYRLNRSQIVLEDDDSIFYVTLLVKGYPPKYEREHRGLPEVEKAIADFKKNQNGNKGKRE